MIKRNHPLTMNQDSILFSIPLIFPMIRKNSSKRKKKIMKKISYFHFQSCFSKLLFFHLFFQLMSNFLNKWYKLEGKVL